MKKIIIAFTALPILCGAAGYAGGEILFVAEPASDQHASNATPARSAAERALDALAESEPQISSIEDDTRHMPSASKSSGHASVQEMTPTKASMTRPEPVSDAAVVRLGRMSVPVYRANTVTYVVSDVGVAMKDSAAAGIYAEAENASRLRDAILTSMHHAATTALMTGPSIDTEKLSEKLASDLRDGFGADVSDVLFLSLIKADVPRI
ncbi:hypothetical protein [Sagittula salina]|uniref:Flagellar protein FliL n=1 Tax=Sagittula salina TaxID=2820268 RepID=A0A940MRN0_9RHOB|nr:hypothetical protein [Sagittula salina]MBP0484575.1 hypothetical protein [Sagittula salina]